MAIITIDNIALSEIIKPLIPYWIGIMIIIIVYRVLSVGRDIAKIKSKWEREEQARRIYLSREKEFKDKKNYDGWNDWREKNRHICRMVEYY